MGTSSTPELEKGAGRPSETLSTGGKSLSKAEQLKAAGIKPTTALRYRLAANVVAQPREGWAFDLLRRVDAL